MSDTHTHSRVNMIDIGSVGGPDLPWSRHRDRVGATLSFEPNEPPVLTGRHLKFDVAVWNTDGTGEFKVSGRDGVGSSLLDQNHAWVRENFERIKDQGDAALNSTWEERSRVLRTFPCRTRRLDTVLADLAAGGWSETFHFLKSDTQSGEWHVLDGAREYLQRDCCALDLELFRYPLYAGAVLEDEVKLLLAGYGFEVAGWTGYRYSFLFGADYLFVRKRPRSAEEARVIETVLDVYRPAGPERYIKQAPRGPLARIARLARRFATGIH